LGASQPIADIREGQPERQVQLHISPDPSDHSSGHGGSLATDMTAGRRTDHDNAIKIDKHITGEL